MKSKGTAAILAFLAGALGIHQFYLGNTMKGICYLIMGLFGFVFIVPFFVVGILALYDFFKLLLMSDDEFNQKYNNRMVNGVYNSLQQSQHAPQPAPSSSPAPEKTSTTDSFEAKTEKLKQLKALLDSGAITSDEFSKMKQDILNI